MGIKNLKQPLVVTAVLAFTVGTSWAAGGAPSPDDKTVKLSGCLIRGDGDGAGYLLTNTSAEPWLASPGRQVTPSALGTTGDYATLFYWLDGDGDLKQHVGHRVEIEGDLKGDVKEGEITRRRHTSGVLPSTDVFLLNDPWICPGWLTDTPASLRILKRRSGEA